MLSFLSFCNGYGLPVTFIEHAPPSTCHQYHIFFQLLITASAALSRGLEMSDDRLGCIAAPTEQGQLSCLMIGV